MKTSKGAQQLTIDDKGGNNPKVDEVILRVGGAENLLRNAEVVGANHITFGLQ